MSDSEVAALRAELASVYRQNDNLIRGKAQDASTIKALQSALETAAAPRLEAPPPVAGQLRRMVGANVPTEFGAFQVVLYRKDDADAKLDRDGELALIYGGLEQAQQDGMAGGPGALVRVHSSCFTGDVLASKRCDCGEQLHHSMQMVAKHGSGIVLYLHQEGRGIGLLEKLKAYNLQDDGLDTVDANLALGHRADARSYDVAAGMLQDLGIDTIRLMTNNPTKVDELASLGVEVVERVPVVPEKVTRENFRYLQTKVSRMSHLLGDRFSADATVADAVTSKGAAESAGKSELPQDRPAVLYSSTPPYAVVDVNELWLQSCGFQRHEVVGKTMRIIQGPLTEGKEVSRLMDTIFLASNPPSPDGSDDPASKYTPPSAKMWSESMEVAKQPATATLINYTKDRTAFVNEVAVLPSADGSELLAVSKMTALEPEAMPLMTQAEQTTAEQTDAMVEAAVRCYADGGMVLVADDEGRENEGDLIVAAECITEEQVAFMVQHCTGIVCCAMAEEICDRLKLPLMVENNEEYMGTKFCVTVDAGPAMGVTTGVSAFDRSTTIRALANPSTAPTDLVRPGHVFPLRYTPGGVVKRAGHTEASVDLCLLAGMQPAGCICELVKPADKAGGMARREDMVSFAREHRLPCLSIGQMQRYIEKHGLGKIPLA